MDYTDEEIEDAGSLAVEAWIRASKTFYVGHPETDAHRRGYITGWVAGYLRAKKDLEE